MYSEWKTTACPHDCPCACTIRARSEGDRIEMQPHRANRWTDRLCPKGLRYAARVFAPGRLRIPLLRSGSGWEEISWEKAWSIWAERVTEAMAESGPLSLMYYKAQVPCTFQNPSYQTYSPNWEDTPALREHYAPA